MKIIILAEKDVVDTDEAGNLIKQLKSVVDVKDFRIEDNTLKDAVLIKSK